MWNVKWININCDIGIMLCVLDIFRKMTMDRKKTVRIWINQDEDWSKPTYDVLLNFVENLKEKILHLIDL